MTPDQLAALHKAAFSVDRSWQAAEFADLLSAPHVTLYQQDTGFALARLVAGEAELLTLAVDPTHQNAGHGRALMDQWLKDIAGQAETAFVEVASDNAAALHLYQSMGFEIIATRSAYYLRKDAAAADALILRRDLTLGQGYDSTVPNTESG